MKVPVLGGRPAGTTTALQADELGPDITLVEVKRLGGTSLNEGSAPIPGAELARTFDGLRDLTGCRHRSW